MQPAQPARDPESPNEFCGLNNFQRPAPKRKRRPQRPSAGNHFKTRRCGVKPSHPTETLGPPGMPGERGPRGLRRHVADESSMPEITGCHAMALETEKLHH